MRRVVITVHGMPATGGSKKFKGFYVSAGRRIPLMVDDCKRNAAWRQEVATQARRQLLGVTLKGPLVADVVFRLPRPKGHYGTGRNAATLKPSAPAFPSTRPDGTKLWRAAEDALLGIAYHDDGQIVDQRVRKVYGPPGATITIEELEGP